MNAPAITPVFLTVLFSTIVAPGAAVGGPEMALIRRSGAVVRLAVQVRSVDITTVDTNSVPHPGSAKPWNLVPGSGVTVSVTLVLGANPATQSAHFGYWRHIRGSKYEFAQRFFLFDAAGANTGYRIVRHQIELDRTGQSFTSGGYAETFNPDGVLLATGCSTSSAVRFD